MYAGAGSFDYAGTAHSRSAHFAQDDNARGPRNLYEHAKFHGKKFFSKQNFASARSFDCALRMTTLWGTAVE